MRITAAERINSGSERANVVNNQNELLTLKVAPLIGIAGIAHIHISTAIMKEGKEILI